jgi:hypothetical protein
MRDFIHCLSGACPKKDQCLRYIDPETRELSRTPLATYYKVNQRTCPMFVDMHEPRDPGMLRLQELCS